MREGKEDIVRINETSRGLCLGLRWVRLISRVATEKAERLVRVRQKDA